MGRRPKRELSGIFDFFKKKPGQKALFEASEERQLPALPAPSGKTGLPAAPKPEKRPIFEVFKPEEPGKRLPAKLTPIEKALAPFSIFEPAEAPPQEPVPRRTPFPMIVPMAEEEQLPATAEIFERAFAPPREAEGIPSYVFVRPSAPPEISPPGRFQLIIPGMTPVGEWSLPTTAELAEHFRRTMDLGALFDEVRRVRETPEFINEQRELYSKGNPAMAPIDPVVYRETYTDFAKFYGIPWEVMDAFISVPRGDEKEAEEELWMRILAPLNSMVPDAFEILKPRDLPGFFTVSFLEPTMEYWLFYVEPLLRGPYEA